METEMKHSVGNKRARKEDSDNVDNNTTVVYKLENDDGSSTTQRRRVITNDAGTCTTPSHDPERKISHQYIEKFCETSPGQLDSVDKDVHAEQEMKQSQSRISEIENEGELMADRSEKRLDGESEHGRKSKSGELELYVEDDDDDDIFAGLPDLW